MPRWWVRMSPCRMRASSATPPDTGPTSGAVASVGRVLPGLAFPCASAIRHRDRAPPAFPRERDRPAAPARTPRPPTFPRERDRCLPAAPARTPRPPTFPRERDRCLPAAPARTPRPPTFPRERDRPAAPARTPRPPTFPRERDRPAAPARTPRPPTFPRERDRCLPAAPPRAPRPPTFPRERDHRLPPAPTRTPWPRTFPRERDHRLPAAPTRTPWPRTFPRERDHHLPAAPARTPRTPRERPRRRPGRRAPGRSRGNVPPFPQRLRVYVQHHLIPVTGRPPVEAARQRRLGQRPDGVRLPLRERRLFHVGRSAGRRGGRFVFRARRRVGGFLFPATVRRRHPPSLVASRLQRAPQHRPDLRRQPPADNHHPVLVHPRPQPAARVSPPLLRLLHVPVDAPPRAGDPLHVRRRARQRHVEQGLLVLRGGDPGDRAHLRVGDPAAAHGVAQLRQLSEGAGHADVLAGGPRREPGPPAQPVRARQATVPALLLVELADEDEQLVGGGLDAGGQLGDAVAEPGELRSAVAGRSRPPAGRRLVGRPGVRWKMRGGCRRSGAFVSGHEPF